jgi:hypothetical protein
LYISVIFSFLALKRHRDRKDQEETVQKAEATLKAVEFLTTADKAFIQWLGSGVAWREIRKSGSGQILLRNVVEAMADLFLLSPAWQGPEAVAHIRVMIKLLRDLSPKEYATFRARYPDLHIHIDDNLEW